MPINIIGTDNVNSALQATVHAKWALQKYSNNKHSPQTSSAIAIILLDNPTILDDNVLSRMINVSAITNKRLNGRVTRAQNISQVI